MPTFSAVGQADVAAYAEALRRQHDLRPATLRNYVSDASLAIMMVGTCVP